jgi:formylglycine-generating enzyme required for sulfatase activity
MPFWFATGEAMNAAPFRPVEGAEPIPGYFLDAFLGEGGSGEVWRARGPGDVRVALKFLPADAEAAERELQALRMLLNVRDSHLLSIFGVWPITGCHVLAMELADGTLADRLKECRREGLPGVPRDELLRYFAQAAEGLDFLNEPRHFLSPGAAPVSIGHGDIKPQNLLLVGKGVKVGDFGLARALERSLASKITRSMTPAYVAPEGLRGEVSRWSDQYSLAVTWCELRGGRLPFGGGLWEQLDGRRQGLPDLTMLAEEERAAVGRALSKQPRDRWPTCRAFIEALQAPPRPGPRTVGSWGPLVRRLLWASLALLLLLGAAVGAVWLFGLIGSGPGDKPADRAVTDRDGGAPRPRDDSRPKDAAKPDPLREGRPFVNGVGMTMIPIKPGAFRMGSDRNGPENAVRGDDEALHDVEITRPFHLADRPVTVGQFRSFVDETKYQTEAEKAGRDTTWKNPRWEQSDAHPVVRVSWKDAVAYCEWLSREEGATYRLPTEAEWEYACRAGAPTAYWFGDDEARLGEYAWYSGNSGSRAHPAAAKQPNGWGLYDMHGNVWQWCSDRYGEYRKEDNQNPQGAKEGGLRVLRGGSWKTNPRGCRAASRDEYDPTSYSELVGFRVAAAAGPP